MPSFEAEIMHEARTLSRLQRAARQQRARLRETERAILQSKRVLKKLVNAATKGTSQIADPDWQSVGAASKVFGIRAGNDK